MGELKKPTIAPAKVKGALRNAGSAFKARKTPTAIVSLRENEVAARENYQRILSAGVQRGQGITVIKVSGTVALQDEEASLLREALLSSASTEVSPRSIIRTKRGEQVVDLSLIGSATMQKMVKDPRFSMLVLRLSAPGTFLVHLENEDGCKINSTATETERNRVNLRDDSGKKISIKTQHLARIGGSTVLALRCLCDQEYSLFARLAAIVPEIIIDEICTIPFAGNIFTPEAVVALLRALTPSTDKFGSLGDDVPENTKAISQCIGHFFRYSPVRGLEASIRKPLQHVREGGGNSDLLIQNQYRFLHEVVNIRRLLLEVDISGLGENERLGLVRKVAWQSAEFIGNTFKCMQATARQFGEDQKDLARKIDHTITLLKTIAGMSLGNLPAPSGAAGMVDLSADTIGEWLSKWALETGTDFNITDLATKLAIVSDTLKTRSLNGLLVPGRKELLQDTAPAGGPDTAERRQRLEEGETFYKVYDSHLRKFKEHYLKRTTKEEAKPL